MPNRNLSNFDVYANVHIHTYIHTRICHVRRLVCDLYGVVYVENLINFCLRQGKIKHIYVTKYDK